MRFKLQKLAVTLTILSILFSTATLRTFVAFPASIPVEVDVFTQKQPYSGKGPNKPSDAFGPEEVVFLYALVTYNEFPLDNMLVAFNVKTPNNANFTISARTNITGIATVNFTILTPPINFSENDIFGSWLVVGSVMVENRVLQDSLTLKVDWIVKLLSVKTIDENLAYRDYFGRGGDVGLEITLRNIAMTLKNATLAIVIQDELNVVVGFSLIQNFAVQPNEKTVFLYCKNMLPVWTHVGTAKIFVTALTALVSDNGVPYCPGISTEFSVKGTGTLKIDYHDTAVVAVLPSANSIELGQNLSVKTLVRNEGTDAENFSVKTYFDDVPLRTFQVTELSPYSAQTFEFTIDASLLTFGNHTIKALIPPVADEADLTDNEFVDVVRVEPKIFHDIAVTSVKISNNNVYIGDTLQINVTVVNKGNGTETFDLNTYYNSSLIESRLVEALTPANQMTVTFVWNTTGVDAGLYRISASAPLPKDTNPANNNFTDGTVQIKTKPQTHDIAILNVQPSTNTANIGDTVNISVTVENLGDFTETFNVTTFYNSSEIETLPVNNLQPHTQTTLTFHWDTLDSQNITTGNFVISASATAVTGEQNLENNHYVDGTVQIKNPTTTETHDIAVLNITPLSRLVYIGDILVVNVTVKNEGTQTESFNLVLRYDQETAMTIQVNNLAANTERTITFDWNTTGVPAGNHTLSAYAIPVPLEENTSNNLAVDDTVKFIAATKGLSVPDWFYWFLPLPLLLILLALILVWLYKRKKESKSSFYAGWTAWYYGYDPRSKPHKLKK